MMKKILLLTAAMGAVIAAPANAATYTFDVLYSGNGVANLAVGSDDPLAVTLAAGDTYTYKLRATGTGQWTTLASGSIFPFFALDGAFGSSVASINLSLLNDGSSVFNYSEAAAGTCCGHLGTNTVSFTSGLVFDEFSLTSTIVSTGATSPATSLLPWPGQALEQYRPALVSFEPGVAAVPEPATWAMMIVGLGVIGFATRRRQQIKATVTYA